MRLRKKDQNKQITMATVSDTMLQKNFAVYCAVGRAPGHDIQAGKPSMSLNQFTRVISDVRLLGEAKGATYYRLK